MECLTVQGLSDTEGIISLNSPGPTIPFIVTLTTLGMLAFSRNKRWGNRGRKEALCPDEP